MRRWREAEISWGRLPVDELVAAAPRNPSLRASATRLVAADGPRRRSDDCDRPAHMSISADLPAAPVRAPRPRSRALPKPGARAYLRSSPARSEERRVG